jgi:hypothetical protein
VALTHISISHEITTTFLTIAWLELNPVKPEGPSADLEKLVPRLKYKVSDKALPKDQSTEIKVGEEVSQYVKKT